MECHPSGECDANGKWMKMTHRNRWFATWKYLKYLEIFSDFAKWLQSQRSASGDIWWFRHPYFATRWLIVTRWRNIPVFFKRPASRSRGKMITCQQKLGHEIHMYKQVYLCQQLHLCIMSYFVIHIVHNIKYECIENIDISDTKTSGCSLQSHLSFSQTGPVLKGKIDEMVLFFLFYFWNISDSSKLDET